MYNEEQSEVSSMNRIERYVYLSVVLLLAGLCLLLLARSGRRLEERARAEAQLQVQLSKAEAEILALDQELSDLKVELLKVQAERPATEGQPLVLLHEGDLMDLRAQGLTEPVADLVQALQERSDLIPYPGVLGGTMAFDPPEGWVISRPWILVSFNDGHVGGRAIYHYTVADGKVEFTLVEAERW